jgi:lipopolysaccharide biosynthesis glycosyltransferase
MFERISEVLKNGRPDEFPFPDQDVLAKAFYEEWVPLYEISQGSSSNCRPYIYNALEPMRTVHAQVWRDDDIKNIHYLFEKPWNVKELPRRDTHKWWWEMDEERQRKEKEIGLVEPEWS